MAKQNQLHAAMRLPRRGGVPIQIDGPHRPAQLKLRPLPMLAQRQSSWATALTWLVILLVGLAFWFGVFYWAKGWLHG